MRVLALLAAVCLLPAASAAVAELDVDVEPYGHSGSCVTYDPTHEWGGAVCASPSPHDDCMLETRSTVRGQTSSECHLT